MSERRASATLPPKLLMCLCLYDALTPSLRCSQWFQHEQQGGGKVLSVRDLLAWVSYIVTAAPTIGPFPAFMHGAFLVLLDGIGLGTAALFVSKFKGRTTCPKLRWLEWKKLCSMVCSKGLL